MDKKQVTAVVLAGGASSRMGQNKALLKLGNKTMIERIIDPLREVFQEIIIITDQPSDYLFLKNVRMTGDVLLTAKKNSLLGIYSGLMTSSNPYIFTIACDMPFVNIPLIEYMIQQLTDEDIIIPYVEPHYEPLHGIYSRSCIPCIKEMLDKGNYKITTLLNSAIIKRIMKDEITQLDPLMRCFINVNNYEEYMEIQGSFHNGN